MIQFAQKSFTHRKNMYTLLINVAKTFSIECIILYGKLFMYAS